MRITRLAIAVGCLSLGASLPSLGQQRVGFVLELQGKWVSAKDQAALKLGQTLPGGLVVENVTPVDGDHIVIANLNGEIIKTVRCRSAVCRECTPTGGCYDPIHPLPDSIGASSSLSTVFNAVVELLAAKPDHYSVHRVRGAEDFRSAVLQLEASSIDVEDLLQGLEPGNYTLQLTPILSGSEQPTARALKGQMIWTPGTKAHLTVDGIEPGLYEVQCQHNSTIGDAWVLICRGSEYRRIATEYAEFRRKTAPWEKSVGASTIQEYERVYLDYLSLQNIRSAK